MTLPINAVIQIAGSGVSASMEPCAEITESADLEDIKNLEQEEVTSILVEKENLVDTYNLCAVIQFKSKEDFRSAMNGGAITISWPMEEDRKDDARQSVVT